MLEKIKRAQWTPGVALMSLVLVGAGCFGTTSTDVGVTTTTPEVEVEVEGRSQLEVSLGMQSASGISGEALLIEEGGTTKVMINVDGTTEGDSHPAHIHLGVCPTPGAVVYPLNPVINGRSTTVISTPLAEILAKGDLAINLHKSAEELSSYIACGDLDASATTEAEAGAEAMMMAEPEVEARVDIEVR